MEIELLKELFDNKKLIDNFNTNATRLASNIVEIEKDLNDYFFRNIDTEKIKKGDIVSLIHELSSNYDDPYHNYYRRGMSFKILLDDFKLSNGKKIYD